MILPDWMIHELQEDKEIITPFDEDSVQPATYDLHLDYGYIVFGRDSVKLDTGDCLILKKNSFIIASTVERLRIPPDIAAQVKGKSSIARAGLLVECAGFVDPGFGLDTKEGSNITLELKELRGRPICLYPGMPICQIQFYSLAGEVLDRYTGHYRGQNGKGPVASQYEHELRDAASLLEEGLIPVKAQAWSNWRKRYGKIR